VTVLKEWTKEELRSVFRFIRAKMFPPVEIHDKLVTVYGANVMTVQHLHKWCREFDSGRANVMDEQRSGRPSTSADLVQDIDAAVQADRRVGIAQLEIGLIFLEAPFGTLFMNVSATGNFTPGGFPVN
jgi:hypothetical protein